MILISNFKEKGCGKSFEKLMENHAKLFYKICQKYIPIFKQVGAPKEDMLEDINFVFYKSVMSYKDCGKSKFSTWLGNHTRYACLNHINAYKNYNYLEESTLDIVAANSFSSASAVAREMEEKNKIKNDVDYVVSILAKMKDKRILKVYRLRYFSKDKEKPTWARIAKKLRVSTQTAVNLHTRGRKFLLRKMNAKTAPVSFQDFA